MQLTIVAFCLLLESIKNIVQRKLESLVEIFTVQAK